jgi:large subunit ribosomal protein L10
MSDAQAQRKTETIPQWKREEVDELIAVLEGYDSVGVVSFAGIPSRQLQDMRRDLHGSAELRVSRNTLLRRALEETDNGDLTEYVSGQVGLIGTNDNPFGLFKELEASKTPAPINAGEVAPNDVVIPEGDTGIDDGQFIGDLKQVGVDSRFQEGGITVTEESTVLEAGEEVGDLLAGVLSTLEIEPKEVGLDLRAVLSDGVLFHPEDLAIDVDEYREDVTSAATGARNLAIEAGIPEPGVVGALLSKAQSDAISVGVEAAIPEPDLMDDLISRADADVRTLAAQIDDEEALPEELRGVEAPPEAAEEAATDEDDEDDEDDEPEEDAEEETEAEDEDDEDGDGAEGLGAMFG